MRGIAPALAGDFEYVPIDVCWEAGLKPLLAVPEVRSVLQRDFRKYVEGRGRFEGRPARYDPLKMPAAYADSEWQSFAAGYPSGWQQYVCPTACHWMVSFMLLLAQRFQPQRPWRIAYSDYHATVWDGGTTFLDFNYYALGVPAAECAELVLFQPGSVVLSVGELLELGNGFYGFTAVADVEAALVSAREIHELTDRLVRLFRVLERQVSREPACRVRR